jgi:hypothetical protein
MMISGESKGIWKKTDILDFKVHTSYPLRGPEEKHDYLKFR